MKRRGFLGAVAGLVAAPLMPSPVAAVAPPMPAVRKAQWSMTNGIIVGVAMETVHVGDFVQIKTYGPADVNVHR